VKVISIPVFGPDPMYSHGALANAELARLHYPGWVCRFHVGDSVEAAVVSKLAAMDNVQVVAHPGEVEDWGSQFWRLHGLEDPTVDAWVFRDADSRLSHREAVAVDEWLASYYQFHIMRDHPAHVLPIMGGMWGAKTAGARSIALLLAAQRRQNEANPIKFVDQVWLRDVAYPLVRKSAYVHTRNDCRQPGDDPPHPFPLPYEKGPDGGDEFVGQAFDEHDRPRYPADSFRLATDVHEWRLFGEGTIPEYTTPDWYSGREHAPHLEQRGHRERLMFTAGQIARAAMTGMRSLVDLGAGDGGLLSLLGPAIKAWGYDLQPSNIAAAKERHVDVRYGDVLLDDIEWADMAVCTEMFEHLLDPHGFARRIREHAKVLVCSSPRLETADEHYPFHTYAWDLLGYRSMLEQAGWRVRHQHAVGGFQVVVAQR
jgi:methyltransferase family protein